MKKTVLFLAAAIAPAAWSAPLVCDIAGPDVSLGVSQLFAAKGVTVTSYGFDDAASTPLDLYKENALDENNNPDEENGVGDQLGLGFLGTIDHELELNRYIQLSLQNFWTADPSNSQASIDSAPAGEGDDGYNSAPGSTDDVELGTVSGGNPMTWELGAVLTASALIGLWLFLRGVVLTSRPSARPIRQVRA
jgi:hypothetical protein